MAFLDELGKTITDTGKEVANKAKAITEAIQLRSQITAEKTKIEEAYAQIGKAYCELHATCDNAAYEGAYETIQVGREKISNLENTLCQTEGSRICAECGAKVPKDSAFCGKCGAAMHEPVSEPVKEAEAAMEAVVEEAAAESTAESTTGMDKAKEEDFVSSEEY